MKAGVRVALFALGLVVAFAAAFGVAAVAVPSSIVDSWNDRATSHGEHTDNDTDDHGDHDDSAATSDGLALAAGGYLLTPVQAPGMPGVDGELAFEILGPDGAPVTAFTTTHEKDLHLIVVRTDGAHFRHVHPTLNRATGRWSIPWRWDAAGSYRVYADFAPEGVSSGTLSRLVEVAGDFAPTEPQPTRTAQTSGFTITLDGDLTAGEAGTLTATVTRDGRPVTTLQPYLGAFGHLVALRQGDLAYLHVHPEGAEPTPGQTSGPWIAFAATPPTAGRYLLYLDFQVDGAVHTAAFVVDAQAAHDHGKEPR